MIEYTLEPNGEKPLGHLPEDSQQLVINATRLMEIFKEKDDKLRCEKKESVFLLDGSWGSGKTTLVKAWRKYLEIEGNNNAGKPAWKTIYVDAYQNDFNDDPLLAIGEGILSLKGDEEKLKNLKKTFLSIWKLARSITRPIIAAKLGPAGQAIDMGLELLEERLQPDETFANRIQKFRTELEKLAKSGKIVVFIDELDRCRPTYAIEMLEKVKHIFSVNGIVFVLVANGKQLCASLRKVYGGTFNAKEYLQKNIDIPLPMPSIKNYQSQSWVDEFYELMKFSIDKDMSHLHSQRIHVNKQIINSLSNVQKLSYRQMQRLHFETFLAWKGGLSFPICPILIYIRSLDNGLYEEIKTDSLNKSSFLERIGIDIAKFYETHPPNYPNYLLSCILALARLIDPDGEKYNKAPHEWPDYWDHAIKLGEILSGLKNWENDRFRGAQETYKEMLNMFSPTHFADDGGNLVSQLCNDLDKFMLFIRMENTS